MDNLTVPQFESIVQITQWVSHKVRNKTSSWISGFTEPDAKICFYSHDLTFSIITPCITCLDIGLKSSKTEGVNKHAKVS